MRLVFLVITALLLGSPAAAQNGTSPAANVESKTQDAPSLNLPVSLENIRDALARPPVLLGLDRKPDFSVTVEQRQRLEELFRALEFKMGPPPPGGLYAYEIQRLLFSKTADPLVQPFSEFTGGQLITLAIENLIGRYLIGRATGSERTKAEKVARGEVVRAISEFCSKQPDRAQIELCWMGTDR